MTATRSAQAEPGAPAAARADWPLAVPGLLVVAVGLAFALAQGGYAASTWYPGGLFLVALLATVVFVAPPRGDRSRLTTAALGAFAAYALWCLASVAWAEDRGAAWEGGNRALLYALALILLMLRPWRRAPAEAVVGLIALGAGLVGAGVLIATAMTDRPSDFFLEGRLAAPIDYANATASLWLIGLFPAMWTATGTGRPWWLRGLGLATACLLLQIALLSQSRGALIALAAATIVYVVLAPRRLITVVALAVPVTLTAVSFETLTAVRSASSVDALGAALVDARIVILVSCLVAAATGAVSVLVGGRLPAALSGARARRAGDLAVVGLGVAAAVGALVAIGDPRAWAGDRWHDFKTTGYEQVEAGPSRLTGSLGSNRHDFYRVALEDFRERPLAGRGAENFAVSYLRERRSDEQPRHPHSLAMRLLGQTGLVGAALFLAFLGFAGAAVVQARRLASERGRALIAAACGGFAVWLFHAQVDWLWAFPGLVLPAFALLAVAGGLREHPPARVARAGARPRAIGAGLVLLLAALSLASPGLAARFTAAAFEDFATNPERTLARLERAASLDPLSAEPLISRAILARRAGRSEAATGDLRRAVERESENWFAAFELGLQEAAAGRRSEALELIGRAARLNPRQPVIGRLRRDVLAGNAVQASEYEALLREQLERRLTPVAAR